LTTLQYMSTQRLSAIPFFIIAGMILAVAGCTEPPPISLSSEERERIDTLYSREVRQLRPYLDSLCESIFDEEVQWAVDSMLEVRRAEEERLRRRSIDGEEF
jgi:hypothetical protein